VKEEMRGISGKYVNRKRVYLGRGINQAFCFDIPFIVNEFE
jgi:hypothetical protein